MIQLNVLSGKMAGRIVHARRFPFQVGRAATADFRIEADGVWDQHLTLDCKVADGFTVNSGPEALTRLNGERVQRAKLRNGDILEIGCEKVQFWLSAPRQRGLALRECLTWLGLALVAAFEVLIMWVMK